MFFNKVAVKNQQANQTGQSLIELVLAIAIAAIFLAALATTVIAAREAFARSSKILEANLILQKEVEAVRSVKESVWNSIANPGPYHVEQSGNSWVAVAGSAISGGFTRSFTIANVCRTTPTSPPVDCSSPGAIADPSTKKVTAMVSWSFLGADSVSSTFYVSRYFGNQTWTQTTKAQFDQGGTHQNTIATDASGGEVRIKSFISSTACPGTWQNPQVCKFDATPASDQRGIFVSGNYAYTVGGDTGTANDFFIYDISNPENISLVGSTAFASGVVGYNVFVSGNYAYVATSDNARELAVVDVSNKAAPFVSGPGYNASGNSDGRGIYVVGSRAYLSRVNGTGADFFVLDISNPLSIPNPPTGGTFDLAEDGYDVFVLGNYAYIASSYDTRELDVINVSNPTNITRAGSFNTTYNSINETANGLGVFVVGTTAYLTTASGNPELYILNVSNPSNISLLGSRDLGGAGNDVFVDGNYAFVGTSNTSQEFQVIDISTPSNPTLYGSINLNGNSLGAYIVGNYAFLANTDNAAEFQVIKGGAATGIVWCRGDWQNPMVCQTNDPSVADGRGFFISGDYAYMVGGDTAANTDFFIYDISNPDSIALVGSLDLGAIGYNVSVSGNYAYVATNHTSRELTVVDISTKSNPFIPTNSSHFNTPAAGQGVFISGNTAYLVTGNNTTAPGYEFYAINITNPLSPTQIGGRDLGAAATNIFVSGNYAYVTSTSNTQELQVVNLLNFPAALGTYNASGNSNGLSVYVVNTTAYLAAGTVLYLLNVSNPSSIPSTPPPPTYNAGGTIYTVFVDGNYAFIGTNNGTQEFQVIDVSNPASPGIYGSTNLSGNTYGLYVTGDYAFLANTADAAEFQVIKGGDFYSGRFISSTFNASTIVGFNYLTWAATKPAGTNIRFQVATNNDGIDWIFVGPDGFTTTFYQTPGAIPLQKIAGQYIRYKIILSSNINGTSPVVENVTVNYSP